MTGARPWREVGLVARREFLSRVTGRAFLVSTVVVLVVLAAYAVIVGSLATRGDRATVGLAPSAAALAVPLQRAARTQNVQLAVEPIADTAAGQARAQADEIDAMISGDPVRPRVDTQGEPDGSLERTVRAAVADLARERFLAARGVAPGDLDAAVAAAGPVLVAAEPPDPASGLRLGLGLAGAFLLFFSIQTYGAMVAQGVVEEKASRVVELMLATIRPWQLLLGKVLGIGAVGLTQLVVLGGAGLLAAGVAGVLVAGAGILSTVLSVLVWYLLGFALYATVYAAAGSLVSRQEDTQSVLSPISIVVILGFVVGFNLLTSDPRGTTLTVLSMLPPFSPLLLPARIALGTAPVWQVVLAFVLTSGFTVATLLLGGRIYANSVLRVGARVGWREALRG